MPTPPVYGKRRTKTRFHSAAQGGETRLVGTRKATAENQLQELQELLRSTTDERGPWFLVTSSWQETSEQEMEVL